MQRLCSSSAAMVAAAAAVSRRAASNDGHAARMALANDRERRERRRAAGDAWAAEAAATAANAPVAACARRLHASPGQLELRAECLRQLNAEAGRDGSDGSAAPLVPKGWAFQHRPGSRSFELRRTVHAPPLGTRPNAAAATAAAGAASDAHAATPLTLPAHASPFLSATQQRDLRRQRLLARVGGGGGAATAAARPGFAARPGGGARAPLPPPVALAHVTLRCQFQALDPSIFDSTIDACEAVPFDVVVHRRDARQALFIRAASVNSQTRFRSWQLVDAGPEAGQCGASTADAHRRATEAFCGPCFSDLPLSLQRELGEYFAFGLGIDASVVEFVCQMGYFLECEAYLVWLARMMLFAAGPQPAGAVGV